MATILDVGLLRFFLPAFIFLFVLMLMYAILSKTKIMGEDKRLLWVASFAVAMIVLFSSKSLELINFLVPWFAIIAVFLVLVFMILMFHGEKEEKVMTALGGANLLVVIFILLLVLGISNVFGPVFSPYAPGGPAEKTIGAEVVRTIFHPRVLGAIFILIIAAFAVQKISETVSS